MARPGRPWGGLTVTALAGARGADRGPGLADWDAAGSEFMTRHYYHHHDDGPGCGPGVARAADESLSDRSVLDSE